jgi:Zn-dependent metalloprotease
MTTTIQRTMPRPRTLAVSIALALLAIPAGAANLDRQRAEQAVAALSAAGPNAGWQVERKIRTAQGKTVLHATQKYQGSRVWGSGAVIHTGQGAPTLMQDAPLDTPAPSAAPTLTSKEAIAIAAKALALKGALRAADAELVVFPTRFQGGLRLAYNTQSKKYELDRKMSIVTVKPRDAYVWAYQVHLTAHNNHDGYQDMSYVIDARTGAVLNVANQMRNLAPSNPPAQRDTDVAVKGVGYSQYSGTVALDTTRRADGSFSLVDRTRGKAWIPFLHDLIQDRDGNQIFDEDGLPISIIGLQGLAERHEGVNWDFNANLYWFDRNTDNVWGDGKQFVGYPFGNEATANGQTAAVDAHYGLATTWDFYQNVFGRDGMDGKGGSLVTISHAFSWFGFPDAFAAWSMDFGVLLGDGDLTDRQNPQTGGRIPGNPNGRGSMTTLDIIGHELTHGVIEHTAKLSNWGEAGSLSEATSDIFGALIKAYAKRAPGADSTIPLTGITWNLAAQNGLKPIRDMRKPSLIDYGRDHWYAGLEYSNLSFGAGVMNRCFYFLSEGASATAGAQDHSPYLPAGMSGVGADHAGRIWYKTVTEYLTPQATFEDARIGALKAAAELYGSGSAEVTAVRRAFAAVNVGDEVEGVPRVRINFAVVHPSGSMFNPAETADMGSGTSRMMIVPMATAVQLQAEVRNTSDKRVEWKLGGILGTQGNPGFQHNGGVINADGTWTTDRDWGFHALSVVSQADPNQYAEGVAWVLDADADSDTEFDAMDLGAVALSWGLDTPAKFSHAVVHDYSVSSFDVAAIVEAFKNAFGG